MSKLVILMVYLTAVLTLLVGGERYSHAYDGDVDFSAPYLTVDPETGKLITVDPTKTPSPPPQQAQQAQTTTAVPTVTSVTTTAAESGQSESQASSSGIIMTVAAIALIAVIAIVAGLKRKQRQSTSQS